MPSVKRRMHPLATALRDIAKTVLRRPSFVAAPSLSARPPQKSDGTRQMADLSTETIIHRRAMRQANRKPEAVAAFVRTHTILSKGR